ncbi:S1 family peptidase [Streptomyces sp. NPDC049687]|uniref:S1 family peptidase n=1 Tax=Streptomyces sp. NPDC049687 TaxID=3365596 RepID=UPI0037B441D7
MRIGRSTPRGGATGRTRLIALASGLAAVAATALTGTPVHADPGDPTPAASYSAAQLAEVAEVIASAGVAGTAWAVDGASGRVTLAADSTVSTTAVDAIRQRAGGAAGALHVERLPGRLARYLSGGDGVYLSGPAGKFQCSVGFNTRDTSGNHFFLTAGHCTDGATDWFSDEFSTHIGTTENSRYPGDDFGLVRYDSEEPVPPGRAGAQDITSAGTPLTGQSACRRGVTTGVHCGQITGLNWTVNYGDGSVSGMIRTNICADFGDSGGPLYAGSQALGLTSGGAGNCASPSATTFYQPVTEALGAYGVSVY